MLSMTKFFLSNDPLLRRLVPPLVIFKHCDIGYNQKGYRRFISVGYLSKFEKVEQRAVNGGLF